jgi:hypothetical protein
MNRTLAALVTLTFVALPATTAAAKFPATGTGPGRARATAMPAGNTPTASVAPANGTTVTVSWAPSTGGAVVSGYIVRSYASPAGTPRTVGAACAGVVAATSCVETGVTPGRWTYTVTPAQGAWRGAESARSTVVLVDPTPPAVAVTFPVAATTYSSATWNAGCTSKVCGTASDALSGVASVAVSLRQGLGNYWNGTAFASATEVLLPATGTTTWALAFAGSAFPASGAYTTRAVATDAAGNTATTSTTFTVDITAPATTALTLQNGGTAGFIGAGDSINITYSEALTSSSICSTWTGIGDQTLTGVTINLSHPVLATEDTFTFSSGTCTLRIGTVTSPTSYTTLLNATLSPSTVTWTAATRTLRIVAGTLSGGLAVLPLGTHSVSYFADAAITDLAGNAINTAVFTATGQRF